MVIFNPIGKVLTTIDEENEPDFNNFMLTEDGGFILTETGQPILLEG